MPISGLMVKVKLVVNIEKFKIMDYKKAGVDIEAGYKSVELMKKHIAKTLSLIHI